MCHFQALSWFFGGHNVDNMTLKCIKLYFRIQIIAILLNFLNLVDELKCF